MGIMHETIIPIDPLDPPTPLERQAVAKRLQACKTALAACKSRIPELALAAAHGGPNCAEDLAALGEKIRSTEFEIEGLTKAHELAVRLDGEAAEAWKAAVQALDPDEIVAGITTDSCCRRCGAGQGCVITAAAPGGGVCMHPIREMGRSVHREKPGGPPQLSIIAYRENPQVERVFRAACKKVGR